MMRWRETDWRSFGRTHAAAMRLARPDRVGDLPGLLAAGGDGGTIAVGAGRSYGDAALNQGGQGILTTRLDRLLSFDADTGELVAEPGVTFADLNRTFLPRGFVCPISPGTALATLGGGIALDVHGKNHDRVGSFGDHVNWVDLLLPSGAVVRCSPDQRPDLFAATIGGLGLTGIIVKLSVTLVRLPSHDVVVRQERIGDLDRFLATLQAWRERAYYSVGWIDCLARGRDLGRGILQTADFAPDPGRPAKPPRPRRVPIDFPNWALNRLSVSAFNALYLARSPQVPCERRLPLERFLYPLDAIVDWNRMYGRRGFHQFQCVIPDDGAAAAMTRLLGEIAASGAASFLSVLKTLGGPGRGLIGFPMRGFTLALDFPRSTATVELIGRLNAIARDHGGRVYLAKDELLTADDFAAMYPRLHDFRVVLDEVDPDHRLQSEMSRRLNIRGAAR